MIRTNFKKHCPIPITMVEALCQVQLPSGAMRILFTILRRTYGENKTECHLSTSHFASATNLKDYEVKYFTNLLQKVKMIHVSGEVDTSATFSVQVNPEKWDFSEVKFGSEEEDLMLKNMLKNVKCLYNNIHTYSMYIKNKKIKIRSTSPCTEVNPPENAEEIPPILGEENTAQDTSLKGEPLQLHHFDLFWKIYPRKVDKGKAFSSWKKICQKKVKERPTWQEIKYAVMKQKKSERWQDIKFIPHPSTWLNQCRWLDDPKEMKAVTFVQPNQKPFIIEDGRRYDLCPDGRYRNIHGEVYIP